MATVPMIREESPCSPRTEVGSLERTRFYPRQLVGPEDLTQDQRYFRDKAGWLKVSASGRTFRMTAEQVLNHVLPALAGVKPNLTI